MKKRKSAGIFCAFRRSVSGHTCTRLHWEVGRRKQCRKTGGSQAGRQAGGRQVTAWSPGTGRSPSQCGTVSLRQPEPWCSFCSPPARLSPSPARNDTTRENHTVWGCSSISLLYLAFRRGMDVSINRWSIHYHFVLVTEVLQQSIQLLLINVAITVLIRERRGHHWKKTFLSASRIWNHPKPPAVMWILA